ncbi:MAG: hypothetical protein KGR42_04350 [Acidobacteria bacterium]|nr:hypothetical protein [Acidobacteriota bacterium]
MRRLFAFTLFALSFALLAGVAQASSRHPVLPPENPTRNFSAPANESFTSPLEVINAARVGVEGLAPLPLVGATLRAWDHLPPLEAAFALTNLERVSRGLRPAVGLSVRLDEVAQRGAIAHTDPSVNPFGAISPLGSVWAQTIGPSVPNALAHSDAGWLYSDGPPPYDSTLAYNIDCAHVGDPGCWGHRDILLGVDPPTTTLSGCASSSLYLGVGYVTGSETELIAAACPSSVGPLVVTWTGLAHLLHLTSSWILPAHPYHPRVVADHFLSCVMSPTASPNVAGALRAAFVEVSGDGVRSTHYFGNGVIWYISTATGSPSWVATLTRDPDSGAVLPTPLSVRWVKDAPSLGIVTHASAGQSACVQ